MSTTRGRPVLPLLALVALLVAVGCTDEGTGDEADLGSMVPSSTVELTESGGCGDVYLWAADAAGSVAVAITVDAQDRAPGAPTSVTATLPDDEVSVVVLHGRDLTVNFCTDVIEAESEPTSTSEATEGRVEVEVDPVPVDPGITGGSRCGGIGATFRVDGLVAADGTTFAPISGATDSLVCHAG